MMVLKQNENQNEPEVVREWFDWLHDTPQRGERARLRRCGDLDEVLLQPAFYRLCLALPRLREYDLEGLAISAGLLAVVKTPVSASLPKLLSESGEGKAFSELRFQRLLAADSPSDFFKAMRRAISQLDGKANPETLADDVLHWYRQHRHPEWYRGARQWQYCYAKPYYTKS